MEVHKKIDFTLEKYYKLKDTSNFEVKNKKGENVRILETNEKYKEYGKDYPIISLVGDSNHITRFTKDGKYLSSSEDYLLSCDLLIYYDTEIKAEIDSIVIGYNDKKYEVTYPHYRGRYKGCDACALSEEAEYDKRICKICGAYQVASCGEQFFKEIK